MRRRYAIAAPAVLLLALISFPASASAGSVSDIAAALSGVPCTRANSRLEICSAPPTRPPNVRRITALYEAVTSLFPTALRPIRSRLYILPDEDAVLIYNLGPGVEIDQDKDILRGFTISPAAGTMLSVVRSPAEDPTIAHELFHQLLWSVPILNREWVVQGLVDRFMASTAYRDFRREHP